jgi:UDP-N-acetylmuramoylalanine--D-glutamate ligase
VIRVRGFEDRNVAIFGLGRSGLSAARALAASGARVAAWDDSPDRRADAAEASIPIRAPEEVDWRGMAALVLSPGVPLTHPAPHPIVGRARDAGAAVIGDIELFAHGAMFGAAGAPRVVAVTGTNGKSTTTALIGHVLAACGLPVEVAGNIGRPALDTEPLGADGAYVLELSSYQIDLTHSLAADVAVLLNITPDHLERHGGMAGYVAAKRRLFEMQGADGVAVIGVDDMPSTGIADALEAAGRRVVRVAVGRRLDGGVSVEAGTLFADGAPIGGLSGLPTLRGAHNWQNAAAAFAAARALGAAPDAILAAFATFPGLAHRMEQVATIGGVAFVNDSKATNAEAAAKALACYDDVFLILGGRPKAGGIAALRPMLGRVRKAYLVGEAAPVFAAALAARVPHADVHTLDRAVREAAADAWASDFAHPVVLLSPACASFDQFRDFEARGDRFRALVEALAATRNVRGRA